MSKKILLFIVAAVIIASMTVHAQQSSDWFETRHATFIISCLGGLSYDAHYVYCNESTNRTDVLQDISVSWNMVRRINHNHVTLWNDAIIKELLSPDQ